MRDRFYLFFLMLHFTTGCVVSDEKPTVIVTGYTGGSVVLPCSCADPQSTTFTWEFAKGNQWIPVFEDEKYSGRSVLFHERSPTNLSLLISDLRMNDQGYYSCKTEPNTFTYVRLEVKGCNLVQNSWMFYVTGYSGGSVVLPCSCTELLAKPEHIQWIFFIGNKYKQIYPNEQIESYKNRVKLFNPNTPGNLSLQISALTTDDRGVYQCIVSSLQVVSFRLTVLHAEEKPRVHIISLTTHQPSHQTQELPPLQQSHHTPQYIYILVTVFPVVLLLAFLALSSRYGKDEVSCSDAVCVKTSSTTAHAQNDTLELPEYVNVNAKHA
ncbi:polymeric immunoglobulin receptor-like [Garra rufa]|uniref:polymeric immunoglobulin receptor-like n=1 Tax=Garra rufa TaxID=137080 RepID=UPI003CCE9A47